MYSYMTTVSFLRIEGRKKEEEEEQKEARWKHDPSSLDNSLQPHLPLSLSRDH
jgi:hypothetical protein